jgi:hypothetical protein
MVIDGGDIMKRKLGAILIGAGAALAALSLAFASWIQDFTVWPGQQTKTAYFYSTEYCYPSNVQVYYRFWEDANLMGYTGGVTIQSFHAYGGHQQGGPALYYVSATTWAPNQGWWGGTIYPFVALVSGSFSRYPNQYYSITPSQPAYIEVVVGNANGSIGCRWSNYLRLFPI